MKKENKNRFLTGTLIATLAFTSVLAPLPKTGTVVDNFSPVITAEAKFHPNSTNPITGKKDNWCEGLDLFVAEKGSGNNNNYKCVGISDVEKVSKRTEVRVEKNFCKHLCLNEKVGSKDLYGLPITDKPYSFKVKKGYYANYVSVKKNDSKGLILNGFTYRKKKTSKSCNFALIGTCRDGKRRNVFVKGKIDKNGKVTITQNTGKVSKGNLKWIKNYLGASWKGVLDWESLGGWNAYVKYNKKMYEATGEYYDPDLGLRTIPDWVKAAKAGKPPVPATTEAPTTEAPATTQAAATTEDPLTKLLNSMNTQ